MNGYLFGAKLYMITANVITFITTIKMELLNSIVAMKYFLRWDKDFEVHP